MKLLVPCLYRSFVFPVPKPQPAAGKVHAKSITRPVMDFSPKERLSLPSRFLPFLFLSLSLALFFSPSLSFCLALSLSFSVSLSFSASLL